MAFWDDVAHTITQAAQNVGNFFSGGNNQKRKPQPGDPGYSSPAPSVQAQRPLNQPQSQNPTNLFQGLNANLTLPGAPKMTVSPSVKPITPTVPQPQKPVQPPTPTVPNTVIQSAADKIRTTGQGAPYAPAVIAQANKFNAITPPKPIGTADLNIPGQPHNPMLDLRTRTVPTAPPPATVSPPPQLKANENEMTPFKHLIDTSGLPSYRQNETVNYQTFLKESQGLPADKQIMLDKDLANLAQNGSGDMKTAAQNLIHARNGAKFSATPLDKVTDFGSGVAGFLRDSLGQVLTTPERLIHTVIGTDPSQDPDWLKNVNKVGGSMFNYDNNALQSNYRPDALGHADPVGGTVSTLLDALNLVPGAGFLASKVKDLSGGFKGLSASARAARDAAEANTAIDRTAGVGAADELGSVVNPNRVQIPVSQPNTIEVTGGSEPTTVPVTNNTPVTPTGKPIVEVGGDTPGVNKVSVPTAADRFNAQPKARPDQNIEGVTTDATKIITGKDKADAQGVINDYLKTGKITEDQHQALTDQLSKIPAQDQPVTDGKKIVVKDIKSIPVTDQTTVPTDLPEVPGTVRVTDQVAPNNTASEAVANAPTVAPPPPLPKEVQNVLDNPKQFNKRQVAAARNQAKLAKAYAKTQESTADSISRINAASPNVSPTTPSEAFAPTGEFGKGVKGNIHEKMSISAEKSAAAQETANMSPQDVIRNAAESKATNGGYSPRDFRNVQAMFDAKRVVRGTPEYDSLKATLKDMGTHAGKMLRQQGQVIRRTASADELTSRYESKLYSMVDDPTKIDSTAFDQIDSANQAFTDARDSAVSAHNQFTESPTSANAKAYHDAADAADAADKQAKLVEYRVANQTLKGNKDIKQVREMQKMAHDADIGQMDGIDASMLSGTGTFARNFVNAGIGGAEEGLFGKVASRIASKITGENVGGGIGRGSLSGFGDGMKNLVDASKARASDAGWNPLEHAKNWSTTGNQLGDSVIDGQVKQNVIDHYTSQLKSEGYKGRELSDRASVMARQDPANVGNAYAGYARAAAGLGSGITKSGSIETTIRDWLSDKMSFGNPNQASETAAKLLTRMTVGFPSAVGRTVGEGAKRVTAGVPTFLRAAFTKDPQVRAMLIKEGIKQAGSGAVTGAMFYGLGQQGLVTGAYPSDPAERERWTREGITENSIKIGDNYYQLPSYLGSAALPAIFAATLGRNNGDVATSVAEVVKAIPSILPTSTVDNLMNVINGKSDATKYATSTAASAVRALTPDGALLNQLAKSFDSTENDTSSGTVIQNFMDKVMSGIPGVNNMANIPDKTDSAGNVLHNPDPLALAVGASSTVQDKGVQESNLRDTQTKNTLQTVADHGGFSDPNIKAILAGDDPVLKIYNDAVNGKPLTPADAKKLQDAMVKGVSPTGGDTSYLEKEQYDTNLNVLNIKRNLMAADPTTKPSDLKKMDTAIKRGEVYKTNSIPYDLISQYQSTSAAEWRKMGDPTSDTYDPEAYQQLYNVDEALTKAGVSYKTSNMAQNKYTAKNAGGSGSKNYNATFGTLKAGAGAPTVQQYQSVAQQSGSIPVINTVQPNIVHKISSTG